MSLVQIADVEDLGKLEYQEAYVYQLDLVARRQRGEIRDRLLLVEHPSVITLGRARHAEQNVLRPETMQQVYVERGGDVTYHGPGQLVAYPILRLSEEERDLHRYLRNLEEAMIRTLAVYGLQANRVAGKTGVWIDALRKIGSIGIACRRWVTFHGLALNVSTDLTQFTYINPCGLDASVMTNMWRELNREDILLSDVKQTLTSMLGDICHRQFNPVSG